MQPKPIFNFCIFIWSESLNWLNFSLTSLRNLFSLLPQSIKELLIYVLAMTLGLLLVLFSVFLFGYEDTVVMSLGYVIGKLLLIDLKK